MVERFNGRIEEVLAATRFDLPQSLEEVLTRYIRLYNHSISQRELAHITPIQALQYWRKNDRNCIINAFITSRDLAFFSKLETL